MMNPDKLIDDLQQIEAGLLKELTSELSDVITTFHNNAKLAHKKRNPTNSYCVICESDLFIIHHINAYHNIRKYNGDSTNDFIRTLALIWICPNCHHRVHNKNPYFISH